jgi:hypothetical protein
MMSFIYTFDGVSASCSFPLSLVMGFVTLMGLSLVSEESLGGIHRVSFMPG